MDPTSHRNIIETGQHAAIHNGRAWVYSDVITIGVAAEWELILTTPNTTDWLHWNFAYEASNVCEVTLFEATEKVYEAGNALTIRNRDRNSSNTPVTGFTFGHTPSGVGSDGTEIANHKIGTAGGNAILTSASTSARDEIVLKQNTKYLINIAAIDTTIVSVDMPFYFHTDMDDPNY
jgi:hypothetical protein